MELLESLRDKDFTETWEPFLDFHNLIEEITCLLTNPKISGKLSKYSRIHAGNMLKKLLWFFEKMQEEDMYNLLLLHRLNHSYNEASEDNLKWIDEQYLKD